MIKLETIHFGSAAAVGTLPKNELRGWKDSFLRIH